MPRKPLNFRERERLHNGALSGLARAAAGLTEGNLAFALLETGIALTKIVELDAGESAYREVMAVLAPIQRKEIVDQPPPQPNERRPVWEMVIDDMRERDRVGRERYGTPLQSHNGRDALMDAYFEALDLAVYLRQAIDERG